jgi:pseudouridine-5'-phosphate glycosidase
MYFFLFDSEFPAFYTRQSKFKSPIRVDNVDDVAAVIRTNRELGLNSGILIGVPVPASEVTQNTNDFVDLIFKCL